MQSILRIAHSVARGVAAFLGAFGVANAGGGLLRHGFDANHWWIAPDGPAWFVGPASCFLLAWAIRPSAFAPPADREARGRWPRRVLVAVLVALLVLALRDLIVVTRVITAGQVDAGFPIPASAIVVLALALVLASVSRPEPPPRSRLAWGARIVVSLLTGGVAFGVFPVLQMYAFGNTDYRRPADAIVVFGARAYADGRPSLALEDRVRTAVELYHEGLGRRLYFSGGPGDGEHHEVDVMLRLAVEAGVPADAIEFDYVGLDTASTVRNTAARFEEAGIERVLAVSQWYHLPRIKMTYARAGFDVFTVPAKKTRPLRKRYWFVLREAAAFWVYWADPGP